MAKNKHNKGEIRRSQLITTYGIGSILAVEDESFMVAGLDRWDIRRPDLHEPRLERRLHVSGFALPPASEEGPDIPVIRFPTWVHCPECKRLQEHWKFTGKFKNKCQDCGAALIPSRFVICCANGHIDDFPYFNWVHAGSQPTGDRHEMRIESRGKTASLRDVRITCSCGKDATMENAFRRDAMAGVTRCRGRRPWLTDDDATCDEQPRALQRGASNVWFSIVHSAISIPPWSEGAFKALNRDWKTLQHVPEDGLLVTIEGMGIATGTSFSAQDLVDAVIQRRGGSVNDSTATSAALRLDEYQALLKGRPEKSRDQDFVCLPVQELTSGIENHFSRVMTVPRLREVRALQSFSRIVPNVGRQADTLPPLADTDPSWLPAIEVRGEGVFFELDADRLIHWETRSDVQQRVEVLDQHYRARFEKHGGTPDRRITPRRVMIHTLAHAVIAQWALDCGYPAASLRERLYVDDDMAGFLILTATSDSAGSLGGLIRQAEPDRLEPTIIEAIRRIAWCSADPLCIETSVAGTDGLNLAACHACVLLPEVSCEEMNLLLDRALLTGSAENPSLGFFTEFLDG